MKSCEHHEAIVCYPSGNCPMCDMEKEIEEARNKSDSDDAEIMRLKAICEELQN